MESLPSFGSIFWRGERGANVATGTHLITIRKPAWSGDHGCPPRGREAIWGPDVVRVVWALCWSSGAQVTVARGVFCYLETQAHLLRLVTCSPILWQLLAHRECTFCSQACLFPPLAAEWFLASPTFTWMWKGSTLLKLSNQTTSEGHLKRGVSSKFQQVPTVERARRGVCRCERGIGYSW